MSKSTVTSSSEQTETKPRLAGGSVRTRWEFNRPLAYVCIALLILVALTGYLLYGRASNRLAASLKSKAELASAESDWDAEIKWLRRYLKLVPGSKETAIDIAIAANNAVQLPPANRLDRVETARRSLSAAVAVALDAETPNPRTSELQRFLILRLSQYGNRYAPEILDKIIALNPPLKDSLMLRSFAIAMSNTDGQISRSETKKMTDRPGASNPWEKLLQLPTAQVLWNAWNANPSDTQVAARLLETLRQTSEQQGTADKDENESNFDKEAVAETVIADLVTRPKNGQAQWILFTHQIATAPQLAKQRLPSQFKACMSRLRQAYEAIDSDDSEGEQNKTAIPTLPAAEPTDDNRSRWDYLLAVASVLDESTAGSDTTTQNPLQTLENLQDLCDFSALDVPPTAITSIYSVYYRALIAQGEKEKVLNVLGKGIERLGDESARLQFARLSYLLNSGQLEEAATRILELETLQKKRKEDFTGVQERLTQERRIRYRSELDTTEWNLLLCRGLLAAQREQYEQAIQILRLAMESQTEIPRNERVTAAANLGQAYSRTQLWDLAAVAFERAVEFAEERDKYKIMAAAAWSKCGNTKRELQLLSALERPSLGMSIITLRSGIATELKKPPARRNFGPLQNRVDEIRRRLNTLEDSNASKSIMQSELELLSLSIPDREDGDERESASKRVLKLTEQYPENAQILVTATLTMAASGDKQAASTLLQKLEALLGIDNFRYAATVAQTSVLSGNPTAAVNQLKSFASKNPSMSVNALMLASEIMVNQGEQETAHDLLLAISEEQQTISSIYKLFELALFLRADAKEETDKYKPQVWSEKLRQLEGDNGTFWRLAEATRAITKAQNSDTKSSQKLELLSEAADLYGEIDERRPRWAYNSTLGGWIEALRGNASGAITLLRRGITTGDTRTSTLLLLVSQLNAADRISEAEIELNRLDQLVTATTASAALAINIAERKGDYERSMNLARKSAGENPRGSDAWLLLAQTAMLAAKATEEKKTRDILLAEAKEGLDKALVNSNESLLSVFRLRIQFQGLFFDSEGVRRELERTLESNVPEPTRSLFVGRTFLQLKDPAAALEVFQRAKSISPNSPDVYLGLAEYYRYQRDDAQNIRMLEDALKLGPSRTDIRSRLALGLALRQREAIPWERIRDLVGKQDTSTASNQLLHALILVNKGDDAQKQKAAEILAGIRQSGKGDVDDATRLLAALETERWVSRKQSESPKQAGAHLASARQLYTELTRRPDPGAMDLYKFGDLLLRADQTAELKVVADQLDRIASGSAISLDLRLRLAKKSGNQQEADRLAEEWADRAIASGTLLKQNAWGSVGQTLTRLGFHDEALEWLAKAYEADPRFFRDYVVGLARVQRYILATDICKAELASTRNPEALALMVDITVLAGGGTKFPEENETLIVNAAKQNQNVPRVIESIATLRLSQQRYTDAVRLYERAEQLAPQNVRILNNLAMALSEVPGREKDAIPKIESAIEIFGRSPELLDTQGLVLLRNDMPAEATAVLREAAKASSDPRYRFHLIMALLRQGDRKNAISNWAQLNLSELRKLALTPGELADLDSLQKEF